MQQRLQGPQVQEAVARSRRMVNSTFLLVRPDSVGRDDSMRSLSKRHTADAELRRGNEPGSRLESHRFADRIIVWRSRRRRADHGALHIWSARS